MARLGHADKSVRQAAVRVLGKLEPGALAQHAGALVARLEDADQLVRQAAVDLLGKLERKVCRYFQDDHLSVYSSSFDIP